MKLQLKEFLLSKPELLQKYVVVGIAALNYAIAPINFFARHLLNVQGLDPNTTPGQKYLLALQTAFDKIHEEEYDSEYDISWVQKKLDKVCENTKWGHLTQETFVELTDLNQLPTDHGYGPPLTIGKIEIGDDSIDLFRAATDSVSNQIAPKCDKKDIPLDTKEGRQDYRASVISELQERDNLKEALEGLAKKTIADNLPDAIQDLTDVAKKFGVLIQEKSDKKKKKTTGVKTAKKRLNKNNGSFKEPATRMSKKITRGTPTEKEKSEYVVSDKFTGSFTKSR